MKQSKFWPSIRAQFWFLPVVYGLFSLVAAAVVTTLDVWLVPKISGSIPDIFLTGPSNAKQLYSALITAMLTMTTISFSTIMVMLTTYSSQFSPRVLQNFMQSKITQHVLGVFTFGFIFVLINLWLLNDAKQKELLSPLFIVLVTIIALGFFVLFIHFSARWAQANFLIGVLRNKASALIDGSFREASYGEHEDWDQEQTNSIRQNERKVIEARRSGYVQVVDYQYLISWAANNNLVLEATFQVGDYVPKGLPVFYYWALGEDNIQVDKHDKFLAIGEERTDQQDISFAIEKLVEIAVKALSPSMNDPSTAINCIHRLSSLLTEIAGNYQHVVYYSDKNGDLRLIMEQKKFRDYLYKCFYQIKHYGKDDISVVCTIMDALYKVAVVSRKSIQEEIWDFSNYVLEAIDTEHLSSMDYQYLQKEVDKFASLYGKELTL